MPGQILKAGLRKYADKFETVTARDGEEAIAILKKEAVALLVTDLQMPKVDGLALLAYMNENHPDIPCIVMSAHGTPQIKEKLRQDVLSFIEKPFEIDDLVRVIVPALERDVPGGSLNGISTANFLQLIEMEQKTCLCEVESVGNPKGFFYFKGGELHQAVFGDLKGKEAALKMIQLENPTISFRKPPGRKIARGINEQLTSLILEAARRMDEE